MGFMEGWFNKKDGQTEETNIVDSHEEIDPGIEANRIKTRIGELENKVELDSDETTELKLLRAKLENLETTLSDR